VDHKAGFVAIIGYPNVGKSTLMNALVGERLSVITHKAQTTRHRIKGIVSGEDFQIVYSDTPGIIKPGYMLHRSMMSAVLSALADADIILLMTEPGVEFREEEVLERIRTSETPVILAINKTDKRDETAVVSEIEKWKVILPDATILPVSALRGTNLDLLLNSILEKLPVSPPYFPKEELTDLSERFFVSEIIREKILLNYSDEIPYNAEVSVNEFKERKKGEEEIIYIHATVYIARESQKAIILGKGGTAIKKLGTDARREIEAFLGMKVFLELTVKVEKNWRENERSLRRFGYSTGEEKE
jgi:GTP-binding protein Era